MPNRNTHPMPDEYLQAFRAAVERRWTHEEFARRLGVSREHVNRVLAGKVELSGPLWRRTIALFPPESQRKLWACLKAFWEEA